MKQQYQKAAVHRLAMGHITVAIALMFATLAMGGVIIATERQLERQALIDQEIVTWR